MTPSEAVSRTTSVVDTPPRSKAGAAQATKDREWIIADPAPSSFIEKLTAWPAVIGQLLWHRGLRETDSVERFLHPRYPDHLADPWAYRQMPEAIDRIRRAIAQHETMTVFGDYDADGVTATAIMVETLQAVGASVNWYLPERLAEGYGLNLRAIERLAGQGTKLLLTVDCGTTNVVEVDRARQLGVDVIVLDHHHQPPQLPSAVAIINPAFDDETYPDKRHSSAGVAFTVARALLSKYPALPSDWERRLLDLVAISTVADMMPLQGENRVLVDAGLQELRHGRRLGLRALMAVMGQEPDRIDTTTIGFQIAPRLNAAGRLRHASLALELLLTTDPDQAHRLATELHQLNSNRQKLTQLAVNEALEQINAGGDQPAYTAFAPHWSPGVIGLVAGRLVERVWRPVLVMTENSGQIVGSGRSIPGFDIMTAMDAGRHHFERFGGHASACGFTLVSADGRVAFETWWQTFVGETWTERPVKPLHLDASLALTDMKPNLLDTLEQLSPYGVGNTRPIFLMTGVTIVDRTPVGTDGQHLRLVGRQGDQVAKFIGFRFGPDAAELSSGRVIDLAIEASWNIWNGRKEPQLKIIDWRPHA